MPPPVLDQYRLIHRLDVVPSFMSLGLPPVAYVDGSDRSATAFDAVISGPTDILWLFKGEDFLAYDLREGKVVREPAPIAGAWAAGALPGDFAFGVDAACWAGPNFPSLYFLFRGDQFIRLAAPAADADPRDWQLTQGPIPIAGEWLRVLNPDGTPTGAGFGADFAAAAKLYGLRGDASRVHFFRRDGSYARHNLNDGGIDVGPTPTGERFGLPAHLAGRVDAAFYGAGAAAEHIFFLSGFEYAEFDIRAGRIVNTGAIEQRFPQLALFIARPQLFLVEEYALDTYIGPLTFGGLVSTMSVPAQSEKISVVITQITTHASTALRQNLLESQSKEAVQDFYSKVDNANQSEASNDSYQYRLNAMFHGEAEAHGIWGGEVDAQLAVEGGSDEQRQRTAEQAFKSVGSQARESTHTVNQRVASVEDAQSITENVFTKETVRLSNTSLNTRQVEFMELLQPYVTLLVLKGVKGAYTDGIRRPEVFALREFERRLPDLLADPGQVAPILDYIRGELTRVQDSGGEMRAIIAADSPTLAVDGRVKTTFTFPDVQPAQTIELFGIVKAAKDWRQPTYQTRPIDIAQDGTPLTDGGVVVTVVEPTPAPAPTPEPAPTA